jgi:sarcosine oxidase
MAKAAGENCTIKLSTKIVSFSNEGKDGKVVAVTEDGETIIANNAVVACGPWTNSILESSNLPKLSLEIWKVQWAHYEVDNDIAASIPQAFHFRKESNIDGGLYYVFPASATESAEKNGKSIVKVGVDFPTGDPVDDMESFSYEGSEGVFALMDEWVKEHLPDVGERIDSYSHPYTMTSDSYFVMDKIAPNVALFSGGSGRAFKFGPLIGDCIVALLSGDEAPVDLAPFSAQRKEVLM